MLPISDPYTYCRALDSYAANLVYSNCTTSSSIFIQTETLNMRIYHATDFSWEELQGFIVLLTYRKQTTQKPPLPSLGWRCDLTEETVYFKNIYLQTDFVRKLEKGRITAVLRGELLWISIQGGFSETEERQLWNAQHYSHLLHAAAGQLCHLLLCRNDCYHCRIYCVIKAKGESEQRGTNPKGKSQGYPRTK